MWSATATTTSTAWRRLPAAEQQAFLRAHPDLYERSHGAVRLRIRGGRIAIGSLDCAGLRQRGDAGFRCDEGFVIPDLIPMALS